MLSRCTFSPVVPQLAQATTGCAAFSYDLNGPTSLCTLKSACTSVTPNVNTVSGFTAANDEQYLLAAEYSGSTFFDGFDFFSDADPTHGYVHFVNRSTAEEEQLIRSGPDGVYMGADFTNVADYSGRHSVRIEEKKSWDQGRLVSEKAAPLSPSCTKPPTHDACYAVALHVFARGTTAGLEHESPPNRLRRMAVFLVGRLCTHYLRSSLRTVPEPLTAHSHTTLAPARQRPLRAGPWDRSGRATERSTS
jgi:hypothetical protein